MKFSYKEESIDVIVSKKRTTKHTYIRVKSDGKIYVSTNIFTTDKYIKKLLHDEEKSICRMIEAEKKKKKNNYDIYKWYKKEAKKIFKERLDYLHSTFSRKIPSVSLRIRKMSTRWGVCNTKSHVITLNLELIKRDIKYLDYVIIHELSHLIYPNHSHDFWDLVGENCKDYKKIKKEMKYF